MIDAEDYEKCKDAHWCVHKAQRANYKVYYYAMTNDKRIKRIMMHRYIVNAKKEEIVDHKNRNTLDNRKLNLRICDRSKNGANRKKQINNKSGHTGVMWNSKIPTPKWMAYIMVNKKHKTLGYFDRIEDAIECRKCAEEEYFGEYRNLNN